MLQPEGRGHVKCAEYTLEFRSHHCSINYPFVFEFEATTKGRTFTTCCSSSSHLS